MWAVGTPMLLFLKPDGFARQVAFSFCHVTQKTVDGFAGNSPHQPPRGERCACSPCVRMVNLEAWGPASPVLFLPAKWKPAGRCRLRLVILDCRWVGLLLSPGAFSLLYQPVGNSAVCCDTSPRVRLSLRQHHSQYSV